MEGFKISLFSQSLWAVDLREAIKIAGEVGYEAIEIACREPHMTLQMAKEQHREIMKWVKRAGLEVSALSLFTNFTDPDQREYSIDSTCEFISLAKYFNTDIVKIMPGGPSSLEATDEDFANFKEAILKCVKVAEKERVRIVVETHLRMLSDTTSSTQRILGDISSPWFGVNLDICNVFLGGDDPVESIDILKPRIMHFHIKDARRIDGGYEFTNLGEGEMNYIPILKRLKEIGYSGYLSIECLTQDAKDKPREAVKHDYRYLCDMIASLES